MSAVTRPAPLIAEAGVLEQQRLGGGYLNLVVHAPRMAAASRPGHFAMLRAWSGWDPLLPRPFSCARIDRARGACEFLYRVVGRGTALLSRLEAGGRVTVLGPLGKPFPAPDGGRLALVGRGLGIAPLIAAAEEAAACGSPVDAYLSVRHGDHVPGLGALRPICERIFIQADDRPGGPPLVTDHLASVLAAGRAYGAAYTCGSRRLSVALQGLQARYGFASYVSLETRMACGFGACKACVWPMRPEGCRPAAPGGPEVAGRPAVAGPPDGDGRPDGDGETTHLVRTCLEGPVFPLERVVYER